MAVAWICWREPVQVREQQAEYRLQCWDWKWFRSRIPVDGGREWEDVSGWELKQRAKATIERLQLQEIIQEYVPRAMSVSDGIESLWKMLSVGELVASAVKANNRGRPVEIPVSEWPHLAILNLDHPSDALRFTQGPPDAEYWDVMFKRADLTRLWPPPEWDSIGEAQQAPVRTGSPGRPTKGRGFIEAEFKRRVEAGRFEPKLVDEAKALNKWFEFSHPNMDRMTVKTIENVIRVAHKAAKAPKS
ncbi:hypothetical protein J2X65_005357 [Ancylobacter sp. 3268]|nr:hypothetical protein [Ancylobacter sp. 3268]